MGDAIVSIVVEKFVEFLIDEVSFSGEVKSEVQLLEGKLAILLGFIKDAEHKQVDSEAVRQWLSQIREIAYDCEDFLDEFKFKFHDMPTINEGETSGRRQRLLTSVKKGFHKVAKAPKQMFELQRAGKKIKALKNRLNYLYTIGDELGFKGVINKGEGESRAVRDFKERRRTTSFEREKNIIGHEEDTKILLGKLLDNETGRVAISIWGTGGLGKTTLARKLYHNDGVKYKFKHCAWVCVSQDYNIEDLLRRIISSFNFTTTNKFEERREEALKTDLHNSLEGSSYLVVIDDVWRKDDWERLMEAFPNDKCGSRVIMTTRNSDVAACADHVHHLRLLSDEESWQLFCAKTSGRANATNERETLGREMVQKCGGLPLAIVVLGGLLSEKSAQEWRSVRDHIWQYLNRDSDHIKQLFHLSFNDLYSYQLKLCFLYLGHFPEDFEISTKKLIRLWVAEGFIPQKEEIMEDVGYYYLEELVKRSMIQIERTRRGRIVRCRVHDILRNIAIEKAEELNLFQIYEENKGSTCSPRTRRQVVYSGIESFLQLQQSKALRSLLHFDSRRIKVRKGLVTVCSRFRLLRVLDLLFIGDTKIPKEIGKLIHLKYFELRNIFFSYFPLSILNLVSLQTLIISLESPLSRKHPIEICKLQELRHLIGRFEGYYRIDNMKNLQTLKEISFLAWIKINPEGLVNLRELHIFNFLDPIKEFTFDSMAQLKSLQILRVRMFRSEIPSLQPLSECQNLVELTLEGRTQKLPEEMPEILPNLEYLELRSNEFEDDPTPILEKLPSLTVLTLSYTYLGRKHVVSQGGFPVLEILVVSGRYLELEVAEGAMPQLRSFLSSPDIRIPERLKIIPPPARWDYDSSALEDRF